ncbi:MAG: carbohydrate-binding protein [Planctomycetota bacterium]|jgi:hypothetical protein
MRSAVALTLAALALGARAEAAGKAFVESEGIVVVEVESTPAAKGWKPETKLDGYTGSSYYTDTGGGGVLEYVIVITTPGRYNLRIRNRHDFHDSTLQNDCWTQMDDGDRVKTFSHKRGEWTWATNHEFHAGGKPPASYELDAGRHVFRISGRSSGFSIDRFHLYMGSAKSSLEESQPESRAGPAGLGKLEHLSKVAAYVEHGQLGRALAGAERAAESDSPGKKAEGRRVADALLEHAKSRRDEIARVKPVAPEEAVQLLADLAGQYSGSDAGRELLKEAKAWSSEKATKDAAKARKVYEQVQRIAKPLVANHRKGRGKDDRFAARYRTQIASISRAAAFLREKYPDTPACRKASALAADLGIPAQ